MIAFCRADHRAVSTEPTGLLQKHSIEWFIYRILGNHRTYQGTQSQSNGFGAARGTWAESALRGVRRVGNSLVQYLSPAISILKRFINCGRPQVQVDRVLQGPQFNVFRPTDSKRSGTTSKAVETASAVTFSLGPPIRLDSRDRWPVPPFTARAQRSLTFTNATTR